jgi:flagellin-like protein
MEVKTLLTDNRAVSPVIGVILMVAITVILAAVIGTFVLGLGQNVQSTPQASFGFDFGTNGTDQVVNVTHNGGDTLDVGDNTNDVRVVGGNFTGYWLGSASGTYEETDSLSAGDSYTEYGYEDGDTIRVVWTDTNNESSATLGSQKSPA